MSISVKNITKYYGTQKALDNVSFEVKSGEIIGFLGPNGAGKSTLMKIICCYLPPSTGSVLVCGHDVEKHSMEVRKNIGYLPEHNPLYLDMYIREYLHFIASVYQIKNAKDAVKEIIEKVGLQDEKHKKIGALSKGYRQRVGLAQAMIHNPKVLILDEPTSGLDPNQLDDIRSLIVNIGKEKTVMLSTHIMQEVEAMCDRVIIIKKGNIVADNITSELQNESIEEDVLVVEFDQPVEEHLLMEIDGVAKVFTRDQQVWKLITKKNTDIRAAVFQFAVKKEISVLTMQQEKQSLEDTFKRLTKNS